MPTLARVRARTECAGAPDCYREGLAGVNAGKSARCKPASEAVIPSTSLTGPSPRGYALTACGNELRESAEAKGERLVREALLADVVTEDPLRVWRRGHPWKLHLARKLRAGTTVTVGWLAQRPGRRLPGWHMNLLLRAARAQRCAGDKITEDPALPACSGVEMSPAHAPRLPHRNREIQSHSSSHVTCSCRANPLPGSCRQAGD